MVRSSDKLPKESVASTANDGRSSSSTSNNDRSDALSKHSTKNNVKKINTNISSIKSSNNNMDGKEITSPIKSKPQICMVLQWMRTRQPSQQEEPDESPPETIAKRPQYLNDDESKYSSSDDSYTQSINPVLQKYRDILEKTRAKPQLQTISILNTSPDSDMDEDAQSPNEEAPIDLTSETSEGSSSSIVSAKIIKISSHDNRGLLSSSSESKSGSSKMSLDSSSRSNSVLTIGESDSNSFNPSSTVSENDSESPKRSISPSANNKSAQLSEGKSQSDSEISKPTPSPSIINNSAQKSKSESQSPETSSDSSSEPAYEEYDRAQMQPSNSKAANKAIRDVPMRTLGWYRYITPIKVNPYISNNAGALSTAANKRHSDIIISERLQNKRRSKSCTK